jgi:hypothetical protein
MTNKHRPDSTGAGAAGRSAASRAPDGPGGDRGPERAVPAPEAAAGPKPFSALELRQISTHITTQWFLPVEDKRLTLLEIDPWRVHAYWNVPEAEVAAARASLPGEGKNAALVLRFTDLSPQTADAAPPHPRFDIEVQQNRNNWYIGLWRDAKHYSAELGVRAPDGAFVGLVRSNEVVTPRAGPSPDLDFRHLEVRPPRLLQAQSPTGATSSSDRLLRELFPRRLPQEDDYPLAVADTAGVVLDEPPFPSLEPATGEIGEPIGRWDLPPSADLPGAALCDGDSTGEADRFPLVGAGEIDPYRTAARREKARVLATMSSRLPPVAEETVSPTDVELNPQPLPVPVPRAVASADEPLPDEAGGPGPEGYSLGTPRAQAGGTSYGWLPMPLEVVLAGAIFSPGQGVSPVEVFADLVIRGRSGLATPVTLCGEPVQTGEDGSFSVLLPLAHGTELAELIRRQCSRYGDRDDG